MICNLSNVVLAPYNFKSNILISQSDLVITGTGSVGTEALLSNKPVCCLGNAPYVGLPNVYTSNNFTELSDFLIQLDSLSSPSPSSFETSRLLLQHISNIQPSPDLDTLIQTKSVDELWQIYYSSSFNNVVE